MTHRPRIIADNKIPFLRGVLDDVAEIIFLSPDQFTPQAIKEADALIVRTRTTCNEALLKNSKVKFIATATIGYDHIDTNYCEANNIRWVNAPGCNSSSVMQYVASVLLSLAERNCLDLTKMTLGLVGVGNVGSKVEKLAKLIGMNVLLNDPPRKRKEGSNDFVDLQKLTESSDIITFHVPLNNSGEDKTYHLCDSEYLSKLNNKIIVNTSRGEVIDTDALIKAIEKKNISNVVLDVWENEPYINIDLLNRVNIATPHIAGYSVEGKANGTAVCVNAIRNYFNLDLRINWYPTEIPPASNSQLIEVDCKNKTTQRILSEIILYTYSVLDDDKRLRSSVGTFENQRNEYPVRREFPFYSIKLINDTKEISDLILKLGFRIK